MTNITAKTIKTTCEKRLKKLLLLNLITLSIKTELKKNYKKAYRDRKRLKLTEL